MNPLIKNDMKFADGGDKRGDCMIACISTVFGEPYSAVYDSFHEMMNRLAESRSGAWLIALEAFAIGRGFRLKWDTVPQNVPYNAMTIAGGPSPRGCKSGHAVVMLGTGPAIIHDPHPSRAGLAGDVEEWLWFEKIQGSDNVQEARPPVNHRAPFLWPPAQGSIEEAGYGFANAEIDGFCEDWWRILLERVRGVKEKEAVVTPTPIEGNLAASRAPGLGDYAYLKKAIACSAFDVPPDVIPEMLTSLDRMQAELEFQKRLIKAQDKFLATRDTETNSSERELTSLIAERSGGDVALREDGKINSVGINVYTEGPNASGPFAGFLTGVRVFSSSRYAVAFDAAPDVGNTDDTMFGDLTFFGVCLTYESGEGYLPGQPAFATPYYPSGLTLNAKHRILNRSSYPKKEPRIEQYRRAVLADGDNPPQLRHDGDCGIYRAPERGRWCSCGLLHALGALNDPTVVYPDYASDLSREGMLGVMTRTVDAEIDAGAAASVIASVGRPVNMDTAVEASQHPEDIRGVVLDMIEVARDSSEAEPTKKVEEHPVAQTVLCNAGGWLLYELKVGGSAPTLINVSHVVSVRDFSREKILPDGTTLVLRAVELQTTLGDMHRLFGFTIRTVREILDGTCIVAEGEYHYNDW